MNQPKIINFPIIVSFLIEALSTNPEPTLQGKRCCCLFTLFK